MKHIKPGETPFNTSNAILAYCLHLAGVPWDNDKHPCKVLYPESVLNKFVNGSGQPFYKGWVYEEAVKHAHKTKKRGHIEYCFAFTPRLGKLLKAYRKQVAELETRDGFLHEVIAEVANDKSIEPDISTLRQACILLHGRLDFMELWEHQVPCMVIPNPGRVTRSQGTFVDKGGRTRECLTVTTPGMRIVSVNASPETRKALGI